MTSYSQARLLPINKLILQLICVPCLFCLLSACSENEQEIKSTAMNYALLGDCEVPSNRQFARLYKESLCGVIEVPENPAEPEGEQVPLNIMVLPATSSPAKPDPIVFLAGGPGQSAVEVGPALFSQLRKLRRERDILLVDQRGTGKSNPMLCPLADEGDETLDYLILPTDEIDQLQLERLKLCLNEISYQPAFYTTPIAMDDLEIVRQALGYGKVNLYGISYGTRAGLVYMRRHGEHVRSAILDGVAPLDMVIPQSFGQDAETAFQQLIDDCKVSSDCNNKYPSLALSFNQLVARLTLEPESITLKHPRTGLDVTGTLDGKLITRLVRSVMYQRNLSRLLPEAITAASAGQYEALFALGNSMNPETGTMAMGMMLSVLCSADASLLDGAKHGKNFDNPMYGLLTEGCKFWPKQLVDESYFEPVTSDVPVLLSSGALDPVTPPKYAEQAAQTLSHARHIVVQGVGHGASLNACMEDVILTFLDDASSANLDLSCVDGVKRPAFFVGLGGPVESEEVKK